MGFLSLDGTFWLQLINFAIFFVILNAVFLRAVGRAIAQRRAYIDGLTQGYDSAGAEMLRLKNETEGKLSAARRDAEIALSKARAEASNEAAIVAADYSQRAQAQVEQAHETVSAELQVARANESAAVKELATLMTQRAFAEAGAA